MSRLLISCLVGLVLSLSTIAQLPTSSLNGTVTDPQSGFVAGAKVVVTYTATGVIREATVAGTGGLTDHTGCRVADYDFCANDEAALRVGDSAVQAGSGKLGNCTQGKNQTYET